MTNDRPMFEPYTVSCVHTALGWLEEGGTGDIGVDAPDEVFEAAARFGYR